MENFEKSQINKTKWVYIYLASNDKEKFLLQEEWMPMFIILSALTKNPWQMAAF